MTAALQLAEELSEADRRVYISVGSAGRVPRRYRGRDIFSWLLDIIQRGPAVGVTLPTAEQLPDGRRRFSAMPALSGHGGGHDTNLRQYAADGMRLAGRLAGVDGARLTFAGDLAHNLELADRFFEERFRVRSTPTSTGLRWSPRPPTMSRSTIGPGN
jgi:putative flavoprotein involved in K+ transport